MKDETKKILDINNIVDEIYVIDDIDEEEFNNIIEGWDPSLKGYGVKWDHQKRKWIVMK